MNPKRVSSFKRPDEASQFLDSWNQQVESLNGFEYQRLTVQTSFGNTRVWAANSHLTQSQILSQTGHGIETSREALQLAFSYVSESILIEGN